MVTIPKKTRLDEDLKVRLDADLKARLQAISEETGQKLSAVARFLMVAGLEQYEKEKGKKR
jgi:predicted DNA-binding protein